MQFHFVLVSSEQVLPDFLFYLLPLGNQVGGQQIASSIKTKYNIISSLLLYIDRG